eukprot:TRINITY_DN29470_c0_g1_i1.p2 TRINITY_DN29470_c0_g1~~TRINITY_DN29470_c0_g1_i1.p2  ORF type:complete len:138 (+),score=6.18 TRINITY_DN29470_c0_g1_i1:327-740(+)
MRSSKDSGMDHSDVLHIISPNTASASPNPGKHTSPLHAADNSGPALFTLLFISLRQFCEHAMQQRSSCLSAVAEPCHNRMPRAGGRSCITALRTAATNPRVRVAVAERCHNRTPQTAGISALLCAPASQRSGRCNRP